MTSLTKETYGNFYKQISGNFVRELYRGFTPLMIRQSMAMTVFLQSDLLLKTKIRKHFNLRDDEKISSKYLIPASLLIAFINCGFAMPFDVLKTQLEKVNSTKNYLNSFKYVYETGGYSAFFTGYRLRMALYIINALFTVNLLEFLENKYKKTL